MKVQFLATVLGFSSVALAGKTSENAPVLKERNETAAQHDQRMQWFREARFGMFIHWGLYAQAAGEWKGKSTSNSDGYAEWLMHAGKIPVAEYADMAKKFNPVNFNAEEWVKLAWESGMRYLVITAKHHDGFAMFRTKASPYNIVDATPYKRDPMADLVKACRKYGVKIGFYYSQNLDWHHPGGGIDLPGSGSGAWDPAQKGDAQQYVKSIVIPQLREILTQYGNIDVLWFDIPDGAVNEKDAKEIHEMVVKSNSKILLNNRLGRGFVNDIETPEQNVPPMGLPDKDWELCMTMNGTWGYSKNDHAWKSERELIEKLVDVASKGGNFLLNVGPDDKGRIPAPSQERLRAVGKWLKENHEAIYATRASIFPALPSWGRVTLKDGAEPALYATVFDAPADGVLSFPGLLHVKGTAFLLSGKKSVAIEQKSGVWSVTLPTEMRGLHDFVVKIPLTRAGEIDPAKAK